ncbi:MAG: hypothetical protein ACR2KE_00405, partial [Candidatus Nanopelagicales bacterium]
MAGFVDRHIGPSDSELSYMLAELGYADLEGLVSDAVPSAIRWREALSLPEPLDEADALA